MGQCSGGFWIWHFYPACRSIPTLRESLLIYNLETESKTWSWARLLRKSKAMTKTMIMRMTNNMSFKLRFQGGLAFLQCFLSLCHCGSIVSDINGALLTADSEVSTFDSDCEKRKWSDEAQVGNKLTDYWRETSVLPGCIPYPAWYCKYVHCLEEGSKVQTLCK